MEKLTTKSIHTQTMIMELTYSIIGKVLMKFYELFFGGLNWKNYKEEDCKIKLRGHMCHLRKVGWQMYENRRSIYRMREGKRKQIFL